MSFDDIVAGIADGPAAAVDLELEAAAEEPDHKHRAYQAASMISARLCAECGGYVNGSHVEAHSAFHDRVDAMEEALRSLGGLPEEGQGELF